MRHRYRLWCRVLIASTLLASDGLAQASVQLPETVRIENCAASVAMHLRLKQSIDTLEGTIWVRGAPLPADASTVLLEAAVPQRSGESLREAGFGVISCAYLNMVRAKAWPWVIRARQEADFVLERWPSDNATIMAWQIGHWALVAALVDYDAHPSCPGAARAIEWAAYLHQRVPVPR